MTKIKLTTSDEIRSIIKDYRKQFLRTYVIIDKHKKI